MKEETYLPTRIRLEQKRPKKIPLFPELGLEFVRADYGISVLKQSISKFFTNSSYSQTDFESAVRPFTFICDPKKLERQLDTTVFPDVEIKDFVWFAERNYVVVSELGRANIRFSFYTSKLEKHLQTNCRPFTEEYLRVLLKIRKDTLLSYFGSGSSSSTTKHKLRFITVLASFKSMLAPVLIELHPKQNLLFLADAVSTEPRPFSVFSESLDSVLDNVFEHVAQDDLELATANTLGDFLKTEKFVALATELFPTQLQTDWLAADRALLHRYLPKVCTHWFPAQRLERLFVAPQQRERAVKNFLRLFPLKIVCEESVSDEFRVSAISFLLAFFNSFATEQEPMLLFVAALEEGCLLALVNCLATKALDKICFLRKTMVEFGELVGFAEFDEAFAVAWTSALVRCSTKVGVLMLEWLARFFADRLVKTLPISLEAVLDLFQQETVLSEVVILIEHFFENNSFWDAANKLFTQFYLESKREKLLSFSAAILFLDKKYVNNNEETAVTHTVLNNKELLRFASDYVNKWLSDKKWRTKRVEKTNRFLVEFYKMPFLPFLKTEAKTQQLAKFVFRDGVFSLANEKKTKLTQKLFVNPFLSNFEIRFKNTRCVVSVSLLQLQVLSVFVLLGTETDTKTVLDRCRLPNLLSVELLDTLLVSGLLAKTNDKLILDHIGLQKERLDCFSAAVKHYHATIRPKFIKSKILMTKDKFQVMKELLSGEIVDIDLLKKSFSENTVKAVFLILKNNFGNYFAIEDGSFRFK